MRPELLERQGLQVQLAQLVTQELQGLQVLLGLKEIQAILERRVQREQMEQMAMQCSTGLKILTQGLE